MILAGKRLRLLSIIAVLSVIISTTSFTALAYEETSTKYSESIFLDTDPKAYYYSSICDMYFKGLIAGYSSDSFGPLDNITKTQVLTILNRMCQFTSTDNCNIQWDYDVSAWAIKNGLEDSISIKQDATRYDVARYITYVCEIPTDIVGSTMKVFIDTDDVRVNTLYNLGVIAGIQTDDGLIYNGDANITRGDACVILDRMLYTAYVDIDKAGITDSRVNYDDSLTDLPSKYEAIGDFKQVWEYMFDNYIYSLKIELGDKVFKTYDEMYKFAIAARDAITDAFNSKPMYQGYFSQYSVSVEYNQNKSGECLDVRLTFKLNTKNGNSQTTSQIKEAKESVKNELNWLYNSKKIVISMSEKDRALEITKLVSDMIEYDYVNGYRTAYESLKTGSGVCQSYAAICAYMLQLDGMDAVTVIGNSRDGLHEWVGVETSEGNMVYIDPTWFDTGKNGSYNTKWFWVTQEYMETAENWRVFPE